MANTNFLNHHNIELMKAALPYLPPSAQKSVEVVSKAEELVNTLSSPAPEGDLSAASLSGQHMDMEGMLMQMRGICNKREQEMIDNMLNIVKMQRLLQGYRSFVTTSQHSDKAPGSSQDTLMEFLMSQLSPDQKSTFENMNLVFNTMNS